MIARWCEKCVAVYTPIAGHVQAVEHLVNADSNPEFPQSLLHLAA